MERYLRRGNFFFSHRPSSLFSRLVKPTTSDLCHLSSFRLFSPPFTRNRPFGTRRRRQDFTRRKVSKEIRSLLLELTIAILLPRFRFHRVYHPRNIFLFLKEYHSYFYSIESIEWIKI